MVDFNKYHFYRNLDKLIKPINKEYSFINNQYHLYDLLLSFCWSVDTCAPRLKDKFNNNNKSVGQCSITSFLFQDIFGGEVYGIITKRGVHCFNKVDELIIDLTSEQFDENDAIKYYPIDNLQSREEHFKKEEKYLRYLLLKSKLTKDIIK